MCPQFYSHLHVTLLCTHVAVFLFWYTLMYTLLARLLTSSPNTYSMCVAFTKLCVYLSSSYSQIGMEYYCT